jgi:hypothetical protein
VLAKQPRPRLLIEYRLRMAFREVLGEGLATACETIEVRGRVLLVSTANPALAHQLRLDSEELIRRLNAASNLSRQIAEIRVRVGR